MIAVEGSVLPGLDEFMLRLGHLKVLCHIVAIGGGSRHRISQEAVEILEKPVHVDFRTDASVAEYLYRKRLCRVITLNCNELESKRELRYPDILVKQVDSKSFEFSDFQENASNSTIWWQDYCLADSRVRSTVGAVTTEARSGSKTGFSHVFDWANSLELIAKNGQILPKGKLLTSMRSSDHDAKILDSNPYLLGPETVILAYAYLIQDMDIFARLLPKILSADQPLTPSVCGCLFVEALEGAVTDGEHSSQLSASAHHKIYQQLRDLKKATRRSKKDIGKTSTAWHRAASRFETYVDLKLLDKVRRGSEEKFKYVYYTNSSTQFAGETLEEANSTREWIDKYLSAIVLGNSDREQRLNESELLCILPNIVKRLSLPTRLLPIDAVLLAIVRDASETGIQISIGLARDSIEKLARTRSDLARLSRGTRGEKAEFVSIDVKRMEA